MVPLINSFFAECLPGPGEAAEAEGNGEKDGGGASLHDQGSQQHEHRLQPQSSE